ncbi:MAG: hypothetical protein M5U01_01320 [Ardenticatenaceae bacterium]|nr:hypothetical protein [Ardenticatenaceae bacterium]HBY94458.1 hypothetical protein [Chloroflexota bacterium]
MAQAWPLSGLPLYLRSSLYDVDVEALRGPHLRPYLEHRLRQVDTWLGYLARFDESQPQSGVDSAVWDYENVAIERASAVLDIAYLQAVRRAIAEALETL